MYIIGFSNIFVASFIVNVVVNVIGMCHHHISMMSTILNLLRATIFRCSKMGSLLRCNISTEAVIMKQSGNALTFHAKLCSNVDRLYITDFLKNNSTLDKNNSTLLTPLRGEKHDC